MKHILRRMGIVLCGIIIFFKVMYLWGRIYYWMDPEKFVLRNDYTDTFVYLIAGAIMMIPGSCIAAIFYMLIYGIIVAGVNYIFETDY